MEPFNIIKRILLQPGIFFTNLKKDNKFGKAFLYLAILSLFSVILGFIISELMLPLSTVIIQKILGFEIPVVGQAFSYKVLSIIMGYFLGLGISFIIVALLHLWLMIFGVQTQYNKTYQLYAYAKTPSYLFGWIPFLGGLAWIYEFILLVIGTQKVYEVQKKKAIWIYAIPLAIFIILMIVGLIFVLTTINTLGPAMIQNLTRG